MIVFVCGPSKSGKSTTVAKARGQGITFEHLVASSVLKSLGLPTAGLTADEAMKNQVALRTALQDATAHVREPVVIDGHLIIETLDGPQHVPESFFQGLALAGIVFMRWSSEGIAQARRNGDLPIDESEATRLMTLESEYAQQLAAQLNLPYLDVASGDVRSLANFLRQTLMRPSPAEPSD